MTAAPEAREAGLRAYEIYGKQIDEILTEQEYEEYLNREQAKKVQG